MCTGSAMQLQELQLGPGQRTIAIAMRSIQKRGAAKIDRCMHGLSSEDPLVSLYATERVTNHFPWLFYY